MSGQQQDSSRESEFDFPKDDDPFSSSEFKEEGDFPDEHTGSVHHAGTGKQSLFEGYKDPSKQFSGHTRSYHQDVRYGPFPACTASPGVTAVTFASSVTGKSPGFTTATTAC